MCVTFCEKQNNCKFRNLKTLYLCVLLLLSIYQAVRAQALALVTRDFVWVRVRDGSFVYESVGRRKLCAAHKFVFWFSCSNRLLSSQPCLGCLIKDPGTLSSPAVFSQSSHGCTLPLISLFFPPVHRWISHSHFSHNSLPSYQLWTLQIL